ncbi:N-acetylmuramoyl-L-alanine amidase family protein [Stenotrophomonas forensis]
MKGMRLAVVAVASGLIFAPHAWGSEVQRTSIAEDSSVYAEAVAMLEREAAGQLMRHLQEKGTLRQVSVNIRLEMDKRSMTVNFGPGYLPGPEGSYDELFLHPMASSLRFFAEKSGLEVNDINFLFEGKPLEEYYPDDLAVPVQSRPRATPSSALVSSSHGYISLHPSREWKFQRPAPLGLQEDTLSPIYGDELQALIEQRSGLAVHRARSRSTDLHPESNMPWEHMSSRYHLKALFPERADMWNEFPNSTDSAREKDEDIRARPNYANHLGVDVMISLHSNGHDSAGVRGTEVYYHREKPQDKPLADSVICSMRELIRAQPGYEAFPIRESSNQGAHGENRIGKMPSVIVETAYHSNPEDAAALQDPVFRSASMKGVEKGYRLWATGKVCEPLALQPLPDIEVPLQSSRDVSVSFVGNPQYPLALEVSVADCDRPGFCTPWVGRFETPDEPLKFGASCSSSMPGTVRWKVALKDADGVAAAPMEFTQACVQA